MNQALRERLHTLYAAPKMGQLDFILNAFDSGGARQIESAWRRIEPDQCPIVRSLDIFNVAPSRFSARSPAATASCSSIGNN